MGSYLYDEYEARQKYTSVEINDETFYDKLIHNFVSPKKVFTFVKIIFIAMKCPPYHTKFLQVFYNNLNILERHFEIVEKLDNELIKDEKTSFSLSFNNFYNELRSIKSKIIDKKEYNYGLVKTREDALKFFFSYVNFYKSEFGKIKNEINEISKEISEYINIKDDEKIKKVEKEEYGGIISVYIGQISDKNEKEGNGILKLKNKLNGNIINEYIGEFKNDKKDGYGVLKKDNIQIEGFFNENEINGLAGIYYNDKFEICEFKNGIKNGRSIIFYNDGDIETNNYENNNKINIYSYYDSNNKEFFTGEKYDNGDYKGTKYYKEDGCVNVGSFNSNLKLINEGYKYRGYNGFYGQFNNGEVEPSECFKNTFDGYIYKGTCNQKEEMEGDNIFELIYTKDEYKGDIYIGGFKNDSFSGFGEYYWGDGDYEKINHTNGWGVRYVLSDDAYLEGKLLGGFPYGEGKLTYKDKEYNGIYYLDTKRWLFKANNDKVFRRNIGHSKRINEAKAIQINAEVHN